MKYFTLAIILTLTCLVDLQAQSRKKGASLNRGKEQAKFLEKQWWLGFTGGINLTQAAPDKRYAVYSPTNYDPALNNKAYDDFNKTGSQATLEATFYYKGFSFSAQPGYRHVRFSYSNRFEWLSSENPSESLVLNYNQQEKVDYVDLPLIIKYDITRTRLRPFLQVGVFYSMLVNANKAVSISGIDQASGGFNQITTEEVTVGARDLFHKSYWGLIAGAGVNYNVGNVRLVLDISYRKGMSNVTNTKNRFSNDRLNGIGDAQDDMKLNNIVVTAGVLFPMRFLSNSFKTLDH